ncbi:MAG: SH3 domain-containing protein [Methyloligellaceae bacterium]
MSAFVTAAVVYPFVTHFEVDRTTLNAAARSAADRVPEEVSAKLRPHIPTFITAAVTSALEAPDSFTVPPGPRRPIFIETAAPVVAEVAPPEPAAPPAASTGVTVATKSVLGSAVAAIWPRRSAMFWHALAELQGPQRAMRVSRAKQSADRRSWVRVAASGVNVRSGPRGRKRASFPRNTRLELLARKGSWLKVRHPRTRKTGWVYRKFVSRTK